MQNISKNEIKQHSTHTKSGNSHTTESTEMRLVCVENVAVADECVIICAK